MSNKEYRISKWSLHYSAVPCSAVRYSVLWTIWPPTSDFLLCAPCLMPWALSFKPLAPAKVLKSAPRKGYVRLALRIRFSMTRKSGQLLFGWQPDTSWPCPPWDRMVGFAKRQSHGTRIACSVPGWFSKISRFLNWFDKNFYDKLRRFKSRRVKDQQYQKVIMGFIWRLNSGVCEARYLHPSLHQRLKIK